MLIGNFGPRLREGLVVWLRRDALALMLFSFAVVAMTFPLVFQLGEGLPSAETDTLASIWQVWWLGEVVKTGHNPNFAPYLFHPNGLDVTFQPHPWTALGVWLPLSSLLGRVAGYNVTVLLGLLTSAYTAYLLIRYLTENRAAAWIGGAFFAFYPNHLTRALGHPNTGSIQWIPLFMLALVAGLNGIAGPSERCRRLPRHSFVTMALAAVSLSLNAYITIKPWMQAAFLGALYVPLTALVEGRWRDAAFWKAIGVLALCSLLFVLPVISPYLLAGGHSLEHAISTDGLAQRGADLVAYVKAAPELPVLMPPSLARLRGIPYTGWDRGSSLYLGVISVMLVVVGLLGPGPRSRQRLVWLVMAVVTWGLSLGPVLRVNSVEQPGVWLPYRFLQENPFFETIRAPHRFALGFSLPWAVLVGYGVAHVWRRLSRRKWLASGVVGCLAALMLFELVNVPIPIYQIEVSPFYYQLRTEGEGDAIIDLPIDPGRAKYYMYWQTIHRRPIVVGKIARMPEGAYGYIEANPLLRAWWKEDQLTCDYDVSQAISDLQVDGFRYIIVHHSNRIRLPKEFMDYFDGVPIYYHDQWLTVFTLADLRAHPPCVEAD